MADVIFDGAALDLKVNADKYHSGGLVVGPEGGLLTWAVNVDVTGRYVIYGSSVTRGIDTLDHDLGAQVALNLNIRNKATYSIDMDSLANGNVLVSWVERPLGAPGATSFYRIYDSEGHSVTRKTEITGPSNTEFRSVEVTALATGGFVETWLDLRKGSSESFAQVYASDGSATSAIFRVNTATEGDQGPMGVTDLDGGKLLMLWNDRPTSGPEQVKARVFTDEGVGQGRAFVIAAKQDGAYLHNVHTTQLTGGDIVVTWVEDYFQSEAVGTLQGRIFHANGTSSGSKFTIQTAAGIGSDDYSLESADMVALNDGRWMASWIDTRFDDTTFARSAQLFGRIYNADGSISVDTTQLALTPEYVADAQMEVLADGRVAIRYSTGYINQSSAAFVQIIDPRLAAIDLTGGALGDRFQGAGFGDTISGGNGRDKLAGMGGDDVLKGGVLGDTLLGGFGNDTLTGGAGDDLLTGGLGRDSFVFATGAGADRITDFKPGLDRLDLRAFHFATSSEAMSHVTQTADGALFAMGSDTVLLLAVATADLGETSLIL